jgi:trk system potassium uptake protein TrkH
MPASIFLLANVGSGFGPIIGPAGRFGGLPGLAERVLLLATVSGRLELFIVLALLTPLL